MVEKLIFLFEDLSSSMEKRPSLRTVSKGRVKKLVNDFTEIKRPAGKSRTITEHSGPASHERGRTLPRSKVTATELGKISEKVTRRSSLNGHKDERAKTCTNSTEKKTDVNSSPKFTFPDNEPDVQQKLEEFHEKLKQRRSQSHTVESKLNKTLTTPTDEMNLTSVSDRFKELVYNDDQSEPIQNDVEDADNMFKIYRDETDNVLDGSDSDDMFGFNDFDEESEDNYVVEAYNKPGEELIIATLQITRRSISLGNTSNEPSLENIYETLEVNENEVVNFNDARDETEEPFHHYENVTVRIEGDDARDETEEPFHHYENVTVHIIEDDDVFEDQTHHSSGSDIYEDVCDEYVDMNAVTSNSKIVEINNNSEEQPEDNYYNLPDFSVEVANDGQSPSASPNERKAKINYVIEELIKTEELYLSSLRMVVEKYAPYISKYTPADLIGKTPYLFGNISVIYAEAQVFLKLLKKCNKTADEVAKVFIQSASIFDAYPRYSKNKPTADIYLKEFDEVVKRRQKELGDKLGLASHLLTPIQRLGKYILMLENILKDLTKQGKPSESISEAIKIIRNVMRKGNDSIAIDSIKNCNIDLSLQGSFIMRASFNILKPRKFTSMVFLFDKVVVFTQKAAKNMETFNYVDSIPMTDLSIAKFEEKPCIFNLQDYPKLKKPNYVPYVLEAETPKIKNDWTRVIEAKLWRQLEKAKEMQTRLNSDEGKRFSRVSLPGNPVSRQNSSRKSQRLKSRSTFYDHGSVS